MDDRDRSRFLKRVGDCADECEVRVLVFCLTTNHVHLVVETPQANLGQFMHKMESGLTQREIAVRLGVRAGKSVSEQMQRLAAASAEDGSLARLVRRLETELKAARNELNH